MTAPALNVYCSQESIFKQYDNLPEHRKFLYYLYENHLTVRTKRNPLRQFAQQDQYGHCAIALDKRGLTQKPKHARSFPSLLWKIEREGCVYFKPNLSFSPKFFGKKAIRWMVCLPLDFDREDLEYLGIETAEELIAYVESFGFEVSAVIRTDSGFHVYLPMRPLRGSWNGEATIQRYDRVLKAIARLVQSDIFSAEASHYFRLPRMVGNESNVVYFNPVPKPDFEWYEQKMQQLVDNEFFSAPTDIFKQNEVTVSFGRVMRQPAMQMLLRGEFAPALSHVSGVKRIVARNNAAFTIALGFYQDGEPIEEARAQLAVWYARVDRTELPWRDVERSIKSAYSGQYMGPSRRIVQTLTGKKFVPVTAPKERGQRQHHFYEIEADLVQHLTNHYQETGKYLELTQPQLAGELGVPLDSLKKVIRNMKGKGLAVQPVRKGRTWASQFVLDESMLTGSVDVTLAEHDALAGEIEALVDAREEHSQNAGEQSEDAFPGSNQPGMADSANPKNIFFMPLVSDAFQALQEVATSQDSVDTLRESSTSSGHIAEWRGSEEDLAESVWIACLVLLETRVRAAGTQLTFETMLLSCRLVGLSEGVLTLEAPYEMAQRIIEKRLGTDLEYVAKEVGLVSIRVHCPGK